MSKPELLYEVKIYETDKNSVRYRGYDTNSAIRNGMARPERPIPEYLPSGFSSDSDP